MFALISLSALLEEIVVKQVLLYLSVPNSGHQILFCRAHVVRSCGSAENSKTTIFFRISLH